VGGDELILPDFAKMTPYARKATVSMLIKAGTVKV
jgi:hypothetical protein